ncbi:MAG: hypothetical protein O2894_07220 [Planctomycetota bacterium]|nr:hypothetical protein [Planctomycetota bacterium]
MYADQQRFWTALLNLQRTWVDDDAAMGFIPPRHRDFEQPPLWPWPKAQAYLLNNLELLRENFRKLEAGETLDFDELNHGLADLTLKLQSWASGPALRKAATAKAELASRLEVLQVTSALDDLNPGTRYIRATIQRAFYYFAQYVDARLSDPLYPDATPGRLRVQVDAGGDLVLVEAAAEPHGGPA